VKAVTGPRSTAFWGSIRASPCLLLIPGSPANDTRRTATVAEATPLRAAYLSRDTQAQAALFVPQGYQSLPPGPRPPLQIIEERHRR
jgi:hypothetical protein